MIGTANLIEMSNLTIGIESFAERALSRRYCHNAAIGGNKASRGFRLIMDSVIHHIMLQTSPGIFPHHINDFTIHQLLPLLLSKSKLEFTITNFPLI